MNGRYNGPGQSGGRRPARRKSTGEKIFIGILALLILLTLVVAGMLIYSLLGPREPSAIEPIGAQPPIAQTPDAQQMELLAKGPEATWSLEDKARYLGDPYGVPSETDVKEEDAVRIARQAVMAAYGIGEGELNAFTTSVYFFVKSEAFETPYYCVYFYDNLDAPQKIYSALIAGQTGEVLVTNGPEDSGNG